MVYPVQCAFQWLELNGRELPRKALMVAEMLLDQMDSSLLLSGIKGPHTAFMCTTAHTSLFQAASQTDIVKEALC